MPVLSNPRHERFAQELAKGKTATDAYVLAGYKPNQPNAARLILNDMVSARLAELQERAAIKAITTTADIARQLDEDRELARAEKQVSAAVSASMGKAKVLGLITDKHTHTGPDGGSIKFDLSGLSDEQLAQLRSILSSIPVPGGGGRRDPAAGGDTKR